MLTVGIEGKESVMVNETNTAKTIGSGLLDVFSTPSMIALMELTASQSVSPFLEEGSGTVGTSLNVRHVAATPLGMTVRCETTLTEVDGKRLVFSVHAYDDCGLIGEGTHERFIINTAKFIERARKKLESVQK